MSAQPEIEPEGAATEKELAAFTATDTGGRNPEGIQGKLIFWVALIWAFFQLYIA